ncbi:hypothetical protein EV401DRAFT_2049408 [Pisolithus croceorrhizus]|nr:hypothetical protein EV401DRAFT_2049408 [Pisolithus croceorrhizus]
MLHKVLAIAHIPMFFHVLSILCACLPYSSMCSLAKVRPAVLLIWRVSVIINVHPFLAVVASEADCEARFGIIVGIDYDNEITCEGRKCDSISHEFARVCAGAGESIVRGMLVVKYKFTTLLIDVLVMGKVESPELWIRSGSRVNTRYPLKAGTRA